MNDENPAGGLSALTDVLCRFGWHKWGKYKDLCNATLTFSGTGMQRDALVQEKRCSVCNAAKRRIVDAA